MNARVTRNPRIAWQLIDGEAVLVDLVNGRTLGFNDTGGWIWSQLDERSLDEIIAEMASRFGLTENDARQDLEQFVEILASDGLVSRRESP